MKPLEPFFRSALAGRASALKISSVLLARNMRGGSFRSMFAGQGVEFSGVRDYQLGDNVRSIDWNVTARMGRAFVKQYEEDRELNVLAVVDCSLSMRSLSGAKLRSACWCAALVLAAAHIDSGAVGAVLFDGAVRWGIPPASGRDHAMLVLSRIDAAGGDPEFAARGTALAQSLRLASRMLRKRSLVVVASDFRAEADSWRRELSLLSAKHDVVAVRVFEDADMELPRVGSLPFFDPETMVRRVLPTSSPSFARSWLSAARARADSWRELCARAGAETLSVSADGDCFAELSRFFAERRRV